MARRVLPRPPAVARVLGRVTATSRAHGLFPAGSVALAAVSGGPDSICLLHALVRLERLLRIRVVCAHVDHRLRENSERDAAYVARQAARLGVPFVLGVVRSRPPRGASVEAWAREQRYRLLRELAERAGAARIAVGHTRDDRAETLLIALIRGGGLETLAGMRPVREEVVRPLIEVTRAETEAFCRSLRLRPRRDPTNEDPALLRAAVRTRVLPALASDVGRDVGATLARTAALLAADADVLEDRVAEAAAAVAGGNGEGLVLDRDRFGALPEAIARRVARRAVAAMGAEPTIAATDRLRSLLADGRAGRDRVLASSGRRSLVGRRDGDVVRLHWRPT